MAAMTKAGHFLPPPVAEAEEKKQCKPSSSRRMNPLASGRTNGSYPETGIEEIGRERQSMARHVFQEDFGPGITIGLSVIRGCSNAYRHQ
jgi:hypothetical protein